MNQLTTENAKYHGHPSASWINDIGWMDGWMLRFFDRLSVRRNPSFWVPFPETNSEFVPENRPAGPQKLSARNS